MKRLVAIRALAAVFACALIFGVTATVGAPKTEAKSPAPAFETQPCTIELPEGQPAERVECGFVDVPEDHFRSSSRTIRLAVAVIHSTAVTPRPDPILYLSGGPGGPSLEGEMLGFGSSGMSDLFLQDRDVVFYDQRGTGLSQGLYCPELEDITIDFLRGDITDEEAGRRNDEALASCHAGYVADGVDLSKYTTAASALDIVDVMTALGYEDWNLYGVSYGTRLALITMRDAQTHIRSVVLDSTYPPQVDGAINNSRTFERALDEVFAGCAADSACHAAYPNFEEDYFDLVSRANEDPLRVTVTSPAGESIPIRITGDDIASGTFSALYSTDLVPIIPYAIEEIAHGNLGLLASIASDLVFSGGGFAPGMQISVECNEEVPFFTAAALEDATADIRPAILDVSIGITTKEELTNQEEFCDDWTPKHEGSKANAAVHSPIPTLVLAGQYDPITPPEWGQLAARTLSNSFYFEFPSTGHGVIYGQYDCASTVVLAFLGQPRDEPDAACAGEIPPPAFQVSTAPSPTPEPSPTPVPPVVPVGIAGPDTGSGGYIGRESTSTPGSVALIGLSVLLAIGIGCCVMRGRTMP
ncbi:MAG TPA: alpha/beta fold hydrolase [Dehalococcoidia bacterium]